MSDRDIQHVLDAMHEFQQKHKATKMCTVNAAYLRGWILANGGFAKVKTVMAYAPRTGDEPELLGTHMIVELPDGRLLDPSLDWARRRPVYCTKCSEIPWGRCDPSCKRNQIKEFLDLVAEAEIVNSGKSVMLQYQRYCRLQSDYVDNYLKERRVAAAAE